MFDPTAFDNMKVVIEGAIYDRDFDGEISIIDRNDVVNLAKLSRTYEITFCLPENDENQCTFQLMGKLENFAAELLNGKENLQGAQITIVYKIRQKNVQSMNNKLIKQLELIWGKERTIKEKSIITYMNGQQQQTIELSVDFNRIIKEEQIDEIVEMIDYTIMSLNKLNAFIK